MREGDTAAETNQEVEAWRIYEEFRRRCGELIVNEISLGFGLLVR